MKNLARNGLPEAEIMLFSEFQHALDGLFARRLLPNRGVLRRDSRTFH